MVGPVKSATNCRDVPRSANVDARFRRSTVSPSVAGSRADGALLHARGVCGSKQEALAMGFVHVESGPLVRSSYHAHETADAYVEAGEPMTVARRMASTGGRERCSGRVWCRQSRDRHSPRAWWRRASSRRRSQTATRRQLWSGSVGYQFNQVFGLGVEADAHAFVRRHPVTIRITAAARTGACDAVHDQRSPRHSNAVAQGRSLRDRWRRRCRTHTDLRCRLCQPGCRSAALTGTNVVSPTILPGPALTWHNDEHGAHARWRRQHRHDQAPGD